MSASEKQEYNILKNYLKVSDKKGFYVSFSISLYLGIIIPFLLYIDAEIGWIMLYMLTAACAISVVVFIVSSKNIECVAETDCIGVYEKNQKYTVRVIVRKKGFCFFPVMHLGICVCGDFKIARLSLTTNESTVAEWEVSSDKCGLNIITCDSWYACDMMGLIGRSENVDVKIKAAILPSLYQYEGEPVVPKMTPDKDDEEEAEESSGYALYGGMPGYEYRDYEAGDSLRKINYKLSAKQKKLMVRRDENTESGNTRILICYSADSSQAEKALSLANEVIIKGGRAVVMHDKESFVVSSQASVEKLREWLSGRRYYLSTASKIIGITRLSDDKEQWEAEQKQNADYVFGG